MYTTDHKFILSNCSQVDMLNNNYRSTQSSVDIPILTQWWAGPIVTGIMAIIILALYFINPTFKEMEGFDLFIIIFVILEVIGCGIPLLRKNVILRVSVIDQSSQLMLEVFWSNLRVSKRIYPIEKLQKFEIVKKMMNKKGSIYGSQTVDVVALVFQSGRSRSITAYRDRENAIEIATKLNNLVIENGGPSRFSEAAMPYMPKRALIAYTVLFCFIGVLVIAAIVVSILIINGTL